MTNKKYFWLRLEENFFDKPDIKIIESMDNGGKYLNILFKLKLKSLCTGGYLRVTESIPYDEKLIATITDTDIDIVRTAIKIFKEFDMIEIMDDKTIYMKCVQKMIGSETDVARRVRSHRLRKNKLLHGNKVKQICNTDIDIESDIDIDKELKTPAPKISKIKKTIPEKIYSDHYIIKKQYETLFKSKFPQLPLSFNGRDAKSISNALKKYPKDAILKALDIYMDRTDDFTAGKGFAAWWFIQELPGIFITGDKKQGTNFSNAQQAIRELKEEEAMRNGNK